MSTPGLIPMTLHCVACGKAFDTESDPTAGQEVIDAIARFIRCNECADGRASVKKEKQTEIHYRNPHND